MKRIAAAIAALRKHGVSDTAILDMVQAMAGVDDVPDVQPAQLVYPASDDTAERKRAADRERMRMKREQERLSRDCRATSRDTPLSPKDPEPSFSTVENTQTPIPQPPSQKEPLRGSKKGSRLPPDWQPSAADRETARGLGFTDAQAKREFDKFRDFWIAKAGAGGVKLDWPATLRNWLRTSAERAGIAPPEPGHGPPPEAVPTFASQEEFHAWWTERRQKLAGAQT